MKQILVMQNRSTCSMQCLIYSRYIASKLGSYCLFTTHFTELAELADEVKTVVLSHVTAMDTNASELVFTYCVVPGVCKDSFGINVAQMTGIPKDVIDVSSSHLSNEVHKLQSDFRTPKASSKSWKKFIRSDYRCQLTEFGCFLNKIC